jgi:hypothetical protein
MERLSRRIGERSVRMYDSIPDGWHVVGIGDFNGDGFDDLLLRDDTGQTVNWLGQGNGTFSDNSVNFTLNPGVDWDVAGIGNFNGDGSSDILWRSDNGTADDLLGLANGGFVGNPNFTINPGLDWHIVGTGDFNGDGCDDILWRSDSGTLVSFLGQTNGAFVGVVQNNNPGLDWHVAGSGDFNGDGRADILWRNSSGVISDWLGNADGTFTDNYSNAANGAADNNWQVAGVGDFNGDGRDDILWHNPDGRIDDFLGTASGGFADNYVNALTSGPSDGQILGTGNFDGDGRDDVLWRMADGTLETWHGASDGALLSPSQQHWNDMLAQISHLFDDLSSQVAGYTGGGSDQNSYYDDGEDHAPLLTGLGEIWPTGGGSIVIDDQSFVDYLSWDSGSDFQLIDVEGLGFSASFGDDFGSMNLVDQSTNAYLFNINGNLVEGTWTEGPPPPDDPNSSNEIVITGHRDSPDEPPQTPEGYFIFDPTPDGFSLNFGSTGDILGLGYQTAGVSAAANMFASLHAHNNGTTALDETVYEKAHDDLAKMFDLAVNNPTYPIDIGHRVYITAINAVLELNNTAINVVDTPTREGANTDPGDFRSVTITLNPQNPDVTLSNGTTRPSNFVGWINNWGSDWGNIGIDFTIFHEFGHAIYDIFEHTADTEAMADSAAFSMMNALGFTIPDALATGVAAAPNGGFDD